MTLMDSEQAVADVVSLKVDIRDCDELPWYSYDHTQMAAVVLVSVSMSA